MCGKSFDLIRGRMRFIHRIGLAGLLVAGMYPSVLKAESKIETVSCGQILEREFDEPHQIHDYKVRMEPGSTLNLRVVPLGATLQTRVAIYEPANQNIADGNYGRETRLTSGKLSGRGIHTIRICNSEYRCSNGEGSGDSKVGVYTLEISCILSDGTRVDAGSPAGGSSGTPAPVQPGGLPPGEPGLGFGKYDKDVRKVQAAAGAAQQTVQTIASLVQMAKGLKFWGKKRGADGATAAPPDYSRPEDVMARGQQAQPLEAPAPMSVRPAAAAARRTFPPLPLGSILQGEISTTSGVQGCRFYAQAGKRLDLTFDRLTGDLGLMVSVFAPDRQLVFQTSVLSNPRISTTLQVPAGEYTVEIAETGSSSGSSSSHFSLRVAEAAR